MLANADGISSQEQRVSHARILAAHSSKPAGKGKRCRDADAEASLPTGIVQQSPLVTLHVCAGTIVSSNQQLLPNLVSFKAEAAFHSLHDGLSAG